ncbi:MAG: DUF2802 domain-containing protein [Firmicutes bacterium]|mgnify:CR=1 FL=1|nr:DUF2802 domain-containing protein [Bacillota bacterium]
MEFFIVFLLGIMLGLVGLFLVRPNLFVKQPPNFSLLEDLADELIGRIEEKEKELDAKYAEIMQTINQEEQRLMQISEKILQAVKHGDLTSPKVKAVIELKQEGCDARTIAKRLGLGLGEVELILSLNDSISS